MTTEAREGTAHRATPWEVEEIETRDDHGRYMSFGVCGADGRTIMDATNSSVALIEMEHDGEPQGSVYRWDDAAKADAAFIVECVNSHASLTSERDALVEALTRDPELLQPLFWLREMIDFCQEYDTSDLEGDLGAFHEMVETVDEMHGKLSAALASAQEKATS